MRVVGQPGEVFGIIRDELLKCGAREEQIRHFQSESESFDAALDWAEQGDLIAHPGPWQRLKRPGKAEKNTCRSPSRAGDKQFKAC